MVSKKFEAVEYGELISRFPVEPRILSVLVMHYIEFCGSERLPRTHTEGESGKLCTRSYKSF